MNIAIKKLKENATIPTRGSKNAAGYDLYACVDTYDSCAIKPHATQKIGTGIAIAIPDGCFGAVFARSGIAASQGLRPANCVGVIDSDYRGEIIVALHNDSDEVQYYQNGERIAQLVILPYYAFGFCEVKELSATERGDGGFGSTGGCSGSSGGSSTSSTETTKPAESEPEYEQLNMFGD